MKILQNILSGIQTICVHGSLQKEVCGISIDSRLAKAGDVFIAVVGTHRDAHEFIPAVINKGVDIIVCEKLPAQIENGITYIQVKQTVNLPGLLAAAFYNHPSAHMKVVGITGTNGKTTCATLCFQLFSRLGYCCGLISTVQNQIRQTIIPSTHTTPDAISLQYLLHQMYEAGCTHVFMEVSSHAIHQERIAGLQFAGAAFTNITHDHLDYHQTFDAYIQVKKQFFDDLSTGAFALTNLDDKRGAVMLQNTKAHKKTYALKTLADFKGKIIENGLSGLHLRCNELEVYCSMIGEFNAYNLLCVWGIGVLLGESAQAIWEILSTLKGAPGRFDYIVGSKTGIIGIVDYAHTPDALLNVLATIQKLRQGNERVITVVGCGGDRDTSKRPLMALAACEHSDQVIFTADNPRSESPQDIINDMILGVPVHQQKKYVVIEDRKEAIKNACAISQPQDIILIAGKGHETYQEIKGVKYPFDDKEILQSMFNLFDK